MTTDYRQALRDRLGELLDEKLYFSEEAVEAYEEVVSLSNEKVQLCQQRVELMIQLKTLDAEFAKLSQRLEFARVIAEESQGRIKELSREIGEVKRAYRAEG